MPLPIEQYALIGDTETAALVGTDGSIDWLCLPTFEGPACFSALLGDQRHGRWLMAPAAEPTAVHRTYRGDTLVLETTFSTDDGVVAVLDFMPIRSGPPSLVRIVEGRSGTVRMHTELRLRFDYGSIVPWVRGIDGGILAVGGGDGVVLRTPVPLRGEDLRTVATFDVPQGEALAFTLTWFPSYEPAPTDDEVGDPYIALEHAMAWWRDWAASCVVPDDWDEPVRRSLLTLKALTFAPTGGVVAAPTTSLPEQVGGVRNWDYRYCWLRDATFTLHALLDSGHEVEADAWSAWLRRAVAGSPDKVQIMYGITGTRRLTEVQLPWLPGYEGSSPVRIGNAASEQFQLDVYGETLDMLHTVRLQEGDLAPDTWDLARYLVEHVRNVWHEPDDGIWEVRGPRRHFTHSKVMAWVAVDRWIRMLDESGRDESVDEWKALRSEIHNDVCTNGVDPERGCFTQFYGSRQLDASLLMLVLVGFLPPDDPRIAATVDAVEEDLLVDGFVLRYRTDVQPDGSAVEGGHPVDGLPPGEGAFLLTTFWLIDNLVLLDRLDEARERFEGLLALRNDVGLLSEEWDVHARRMVGNFPQAFSHVGLVNTACNLFHRLNGPAAKRAEGRRGSRTHRSVG